MAAKVQLHNFRFSIYIDVDGTVTLTDLPPELREVAEALDPAQPWRSTCRSSAPSETTSSAEATAARRATSGAADEDRRG